jgi:hypothetical protein
MAQVESNTEFSGGGRRGVEAFPFSEAEWVAVSEAALPVVNAGLAGDAVLRAEHLVGLLEVLAGLRARYGGHPALLETEADFAEDEEERAALYRRAVRLAVAHGLPTLSIRLSLARLLLDTGLREAARVELLSCAGEARASDEPDQAAWAEMVAESEHAESGPSAGRSRD